MLASSSTEDFYNINIGDGYKIVVKPTIGVGDCQVAGCHNNLDKNCPLELRLVEGLIGRVVKESRNSLAPVDIHAMVHASDKGDLNLLPEERLHAPLYTPKAGTFIYTQA
ncbi:hypothetical protein CRG98_046145 [Punica granatum]|uniref:Uncharacterized protein n=1 Tax=Punica granatum TaxID=22663 RepID=A0A2I0HP38_PUNGR|nr:hypothetical protein CRG98_046145 [Punica granatum]